MRKQATLTLLCGLIGSAQLFSQGSSGFVDAGYSSPRISGIHVAPGQVVTLFVPGISVPGLDGSDISAGIFADRVPWPRTLAGFTVTLRQTQYPFPIELPIASVRSANACWEEVLCRALDTPFAAITVQIPFELQPNFPTQGRPPNSAALLISQDGVAKGAFSISPEVDQIHVLHSSDSVFRNPSDYGPLITHADGRLVSDANPAETGEALVMYAVGLGPTSPGVATGAAAGAAAEASAVVAFQFGEDVLPKRPGSPPVTLPDVPKPLYAGLSPGSVGLYQINFRVPEIPSGTPSCGEILDFGPVNSNLTVTVIGPTSFDGAGLCVRVR